MKSLRNITRFTYENTSFLGWRVTLCRRQCHYTRYFSDRVYGGEQAALQAAIHARAVVLSRLEESPNHPSRVFSLCRREETAPLPAGLNAPRGKA